MKNTVSLAGDYLAHYLQTQQLTNLNYYRTETSAKDSTNAGIHKGIQRLLSSIKMEEELVETKAQKEQLQLGEEKPSWKCCNFS